MASYAYFCLIKFNWSPSYFFKLPAEERYMVIAMIDQYIKEKEKERRETEIRMRRR